jgi:hypothetical protein
LAWLSMIPVSGQHSMLLAHDFTTLQIQSKHVF